MGCKGLTARRGKEAIEAYKKNKEQIDIVILDMVMPDMSGGETYDRMKEIDPDIKVPSFEWIQHQWSGDRDIGSRFLS